MNLLDLRTRFRNEVKDTAQPYLNTDAQVNEWINEAVDEACRRALLLVDSTTEASYVDFAASAVGIDLHPSVIFVRRATLAASSMPLLPRVARTMDEEVPGWESAQPSTPRVFIPDWQTNYLRFYPPALAADRLKMTVVRTPLDIMSSDSDEPEILPRYHARLLDWVKFRAYSVQDSDIYDTKKAALHEAAFIQQFGQASAVNEHWALEQYYEVGAN